MRESSRVDTVLICAYVLIFSDHRMLMTSIKPLIDPSSLSHLQVPHRSRKRVLKMTIVVGIPLPLPGRVILALLPGMRRVMLVAAVMKRKRMSQRGMHPPPWPT
jgi:hypothetical protein